MTKKAEVKTEEAAIPEEPRTLAILQVDGKLEYVSAPTIPKLRRLLKKYPPQALVEVWRGRKLALRRELLVKF